MFQAEHADAETFRWADGVLEACQAFRQGDVVSDLSIAYSACDSEPIATLIEPGGEQRLIGVRTDLQYAMITSQTCDLAGERGSKYPLFLAAPVYNIADVAPPGDLGNIRADRVGQFVSLDGPQFTREGQVWVADLRFETAIEKSILARRQPLQAFATEDGYLRCARKIARVRVRAAIDDTILAHILKPLERKFARGEITHEQIADILIKATPKTAAANAARLYVIVASESAVPELSAAFDDWHAEINPTLPAGFTFLGVDVRTEERFTWRDFRGAELVDFSYLTPD